MPRISKAVIKDHSVWGEGLFVWAVYKIEVTHDDKEWSIYRRFSHFTSLQQELVKVYGEPYMAPYQAILNNPGSSGAGTGAVGEFADAVWQNTVMAVPTDTAISTRKPLLNRYLEQLLANEHICQQPIFLSFLDTARKGIPGSVKLLGEENIVYQIMTNTNKPTFYVDMYPLWSIKFIIVAKTGTLYLFTTMYDPFDKAELTLDLRRQSKLTSDGNILHIRVDDKRLSLELPNRDDVASWMRVLSNFSMRASTSDVLESTTSATIADPPVPSNVAQAPQMKSDPNIPTSEDNAYGF